MIASSSSGPVRAAWSPEFAPGSASTSASTPTSSRLVFAVLTIFSIGAGALVYLIAWIVVPEEGEKQSIAENYLNKTKKS